MTTTTRPAHLHYRYAQLIGQLLVCLAIGAVVLLSLLVSHYGNASTFNEGYTVGGDTSAVELGLEVRGAPGMFGYAHTPWGVLGYFSTATGGTLDGFTWCPTGDSDVECGA